MRLTLLPEYFLKQKVWILLCVAIITQFLCPSGLLSKQKKAGLYHDLFSVNFPTENDGWACGRRGTVLHTSDGGDTWTRQDSGTEFTLAAVHFADSKNGIAVGHEGTIIHTSDGGMTWERQQSPVDFFLMDVYCISSLKAVIVTERTHILITNNGGKTWAIGFNDRDFILKALSFCDSLHGWAVGEYGFIYYTADGGVTWKKQAGNYGFSPTTGALVGDKYLFDITAINPKEAWAVGIEGYIKRTLDGGKTWQEVISNVTETNLYFVNSGEKGEILVGGKGVLLVSHDNGKRWLSAKCEPPIRYGWLYGLSRQGGAGYVSVGQGGAIYSSGKKAWQKVIY